MKDEVAMTSLFFFFFNGFGGVFIYSQNTLPSHSIVVFAELSSAAVSKAMGGVESSILLVLTASWVGSSSYLSSVHSDVSKRRS